MSRGIHAKFIKLLFASIAFYSLFHSANELHAQKEQTNGEQSTANSSKVSYKDERIGIKVKADRAKVRVGDKIRLIFEIKHAKTWHSYWLNPAGPGQAPAVDWKLPAGVKVGKLLFPTPKRFSSFGGQFVNFGYDGYSHLLVELEVTPTFSQNIPTQKEDFFNDNTPIEPENNQKINLSELVIAGDLSWVVCSDEECVPGDFDFALKIPLTSDADEKDANKTKLAAKIDRLFAELPIQSNEDLLPWHADAVIKKNGEVNFFLRATEKAKSLKDFWQKNVVNVHVFPRTEGLFEIKKAAELHIFPDNSILIKCQAIDDFEDAEIPAKLELLLVAEAKTDEKENLPQGLQRFLQKEDAKAAKISWYISADLKDESEFAKVFANHSKESQTKILRESFASKKNEKSKLPETQNFSNVKTKSSFWIEMISAFLGGLILNVMPCVFPIVSLKILSIVGQAGRKRSTLLAHGASYSLGIFVSFALLAGVMAFLRKGVEGGGLGWAFQLQNPLFVLLICALLFILALNLAGVFEFGFMISGGAARAEGKLRQSSVSFFGDVSAGFLAVLIATPCAGPFLGTAIGFALRSSPITIFAIFMAMAFGFALPYFVLLNFPSILAKLPRSGAWMEKFKKLLSIPMFAAAMWLLWTFSMMKPSSWLYAILALSLFSFCAWTLGTFALGGALSRWLSRIAALFLLIIGLHFAKSATIEKTSSWEKFSDERYRELVANGDAFYIDFTAAWCVTCATNKLAYTKTVMRQIAKNDIKLVRADWTNKNEEILKALARYGRSSIPLNVYYPKTKSGSRRHAEILPALLTPSILKKTLR